MKDVLLRASACRALAALLPLLLLAASPSAAAPPDSLLVTFFRNLEAGRPQTVVVYGTSLSRGGAWATAAQTWFDEQYPGRVTFLNSAGPGQNSDWGLANLQDRVLAHRPGLVFIEFSYNDAHDKFEMPVARGAANLDAMVRAIRAQQAGTAIVLQIMNPAWDAPNGNRSRSVRPQLEAFNDNYRCYARAQGLPLIDHYVAWQRLQASDPARFQTLIPDGSHPSEEGSLTVTWPAIRGLLEAAQKAARQAHGGH